MTKRMLAALALGAVALTATPAPAGADSTYKGGCHWIATNAPEGTSEVWNGVIYAAVVVYSEGTPSGNPVSATVTCTLLVNGVPVRETPFSGTGVIAGAQHLQYTAAWDDIVTLCETVDYVSDATPTTTYCVTPSPQPVVPQPIQDIIDYLFTVCCGPIILPLDPLLCPVLAQLDPLDVPGVVEVNGQGDVFLAGELFWDCPPYDPGA